MATIHFEDKSVPYNVFVNDVAARVVSLLKAEKSDPERISQRKAYTMFGRGNVERWRKQGKIQPCKRPGKIEYVTADLRQLQRTQQDYFNP